MNVNEQQNTRTVGNTLMPVVFALLLMGAGLLAGCERKAVSASSGSMPPMPVSVVKIQPADVAITNEWVGTLDGFVNAQIQPQVSGYLIRQNIAKAPQVAKGQVLFEIDPRPFQAALEQAKDNSGRRKAQLALAQINVNRDTPLAEAHAIARSQLDNEIQQQAQAEAQLSKTAEAAVATAKLNSALQVRSLITGVAGRPPPGRQPRQHAVRSHFGFATRSHQGLLLHQRQRVSCAHSTSAGQAAAICCTALPKFR